MKREKIFMGLAQMKVKEEVIDVCDDPASAMQWSFTNQVSSLSPFPSQERLRKFGYDSLTPTGYMTISTSEASLKNPYSNMKQRNSSLEKQTGSNYPVANYPSTQFDAHAFPHEARLFSNTDRTNQIVPASMNNPAHQSIITSAGSNAIISPVNVQPVEAVPINVAPATVAPCCTSIVGNTDLRIATNTPKAPAQMTIFYSGLVCVYDNVSPEKAQAIMLLAGNTPRSTNPMPSLPPNATAPAQLQAQAQIPRPSSVDSFVINRSHGSSPAADLLGHISLTSNNNAQSIGLSTGTNEITARKPLEFFLSPAVPEPLRVVSSLRAAPAIQPILNSSAVPQARKASLARFLEKRKERAMCAAPYNKTQSADSNAFGQGSKSFSMNSASSSASALPTVITLQ